MVEKDEEYAELVYIISKPVVDKIDYVTVTFTDDKGLNEEVTVVKGEGRCSGVHRSRWLSGRG